MSAFAKPRMRSRIYSFFLSIFLFLFLDPFYIVLYAASVSFLFVQFLAALGDRLVSLVVKPAVQVGITDCTKLKRTSLG
jgi:hypothetical protein